MKKAIVLLSGGLDSSVAIHLAKSEGYEVYALSFSYGQKHSKELECAKAIAKTVGAAGHNIITLQLNLWGGSSLTDSA
ncbi:MAG: 7-cyano-7-deazaguanine synthase, partial [Prolixibacteraceae bacterium]|nr:7-cyano-7-deazaguanine synthase [Prolixibacteraceae bacterium]